MLLPEKAFSHRLASEYFGKGLHRIVAQALRITAIFLRSLRIESIFVHWKLISLLASTVVSINGVISRLKAKSGETTP